MKKIVVTAFAVLALTLAVSATAFAQSSVEGYNKPGGQVQGIVQGGGEDQPESDENSPTPVASANGGGGGDSEGGLPFTGLDVALLAAAGGLLLAAGFGMRRLTRPPTAA